MVDVFTRQVRSQIMSRNRSHGTKATERRLRALLVQRGVRGWKLGVSSDLPGRPDFVFPRARLAVFVDGCFWHGCTRCRSIPATNVEFWRAKISGNRRRDRAVDRKLRRAGWSVVRIWEHELRTDREGAVKRVLRGLHRAP